MAWIPDADPTLRDRVEAEVNLMDFVVWLVACKPSGRHVSVESARKYVSEVQGWHWREFGWRIGEGLDMKRLRDLYKSLEKVIERKPTRVRYGVRTQLLARAMEQELRGDSADVLNWRAALSTGFCALLRGAEFALQDKQEWDPALCLSRADVSFFREHGVLHARLYMRPAKSEKHLRGKTVPIVLVEGGSLLDPVRALYALVRGDPVPQAERATTPLFRWGEARGATATERAFTVRHVRNMVRALMRAVGEDGAMFGAHSLRIGGATAALAAGIDPSLIRLMGRWSSDVYLIYCRMSRQAATKLGAVIGSTEFADLERGGFTSEELEVLPFECQDLDLDCEDDEM